jgi:hypothetical protein
MAMMTARTTRVLGTLLVAMTVGSLLLMVLETEPPQRAATEAAIARLRQDAANWQLTHPWKRIIVHASRGGPDQLPNRCHFIIHAAPTENGWVSPTKLWTAQQPGRHVYVAGQNFVDDSVGICLMGDFTAAAPSHEQMAALMTLVQQLQQRCDVPAECVYLNSDLNPESPNPGPAFPAAEFDRQLYRR